MSGSARTDDTEQSWPDRRVRPFGRAGRPGGWVAAAALCLVLGACTSAPTDDPASGPSATAPAPGNTSTSAGPSSASPGATSGAPSSGASTTRSPATAPSSTDSPPGDAIIINVTESGGDVTPNGEKMSARVGQQVQLEVISDRDDVIHAHTGDDGYELKVTAGVPASGTFTLDSAGSFEVESHQLDKVIVILNAR